MFCRNSRADRLPPNVKAGRCLRLSVSHRSAVTFQRHVYTCQGLVSRVRATCHGTRGDGEISSPDRVVGGRGRAHTTPTRATTERRVQSHGVMRWVRAPAQYLEGLVSTPAHKRQKNARAPHATHARVRIPFTRGATTHPHNARRNPRRNPAHARCHLPAAPSISPWQGACLSSHATSAPAATSPSAAASSPASKGPPKPTTAATEAKWPATTEAKVRHLLLWRRSPGIG